MKSTSQGKGNEADTVGGKEGAIEVANVYACGRNGPTVWIVVYVVRVKQSRVKGVQCSGVQLPDDLDRCAA
jgi:hypothetical protein